jgi:hexosaminidase
MEINFVNLPDELSAGVNYLKDMLNLKIGTGTPVAVKKGSEIKVRYYNGKGEITYIDKHTFFRALGLYLENAAKGGDFDVSERPHFETVGVMIDASRNGVMTVEAIKRFLNYIALAGYNMLMMYTEDVYKIKSRKYFGYMRGSYTYDELHECDLYAQDLGIEMIPCIQTYGHLEQYLKWSEAHDIRDTASVLLAEEEATYSFIEDMILSATAPFKSKRIHIGMDEAWDMGRGNYMNKKGYKDPFEIFTNHLNRVIEITKKYNLKPMMWSDMFFRISSSEHRYYSKDTVIPPDVMEKIPKEVQLVYWHYGEEPGCDGYMLDKHIDTERDVIFAGGLWTWSVHLPEINYAMKSTNEALLECKKRNIKEMITTIWSNDNSEMDPFASLLGIWYTAEHCYNDDVCMETLKNRFEFLTGANFNAFMEMGEYNNIFDDGREYKNFHERFMGKKLFWQDVMEGLVDEFLYKQPMSEHYKKYAEKMAGYAAKGGKWKDIYEFCSAVFSMLETKCYIAERLKPAYDNKDREFLAEAARKHFPLLCEKIKTVHALHKKQWFSSKKVFGWAALDIRYGGLLARANTAIERLEGYIRGDIPSLEELQEERLPFDKGAFMSYPRIHSSYLAK